MLESFKARYIRYLPIPLKRKENSSYLDLNSVSWVTIPPPLCLWDRENITTIIPGWLTMELSLKCKACSCAGQQPDLLNSTTFIQDCGNSLLFINGATKVQSLGQCNTWFIFFMLSAKIQITWVFNLIGKLFCYRKTCISIFNSLYILI